MAAYRGWGTLIALTGLILLPAGTCAQQATNLLLGYGATWKYDATDVYFEDSWREPEYDDWHWLAGPGVLGYPSFERLPDPVVAEGGSLRTRLFVRDPASIPTIYFRTRFHVNGPVEKRLLIATVAVDEGAVFYLNGREVHRVNMPAGPISPYTAAATLVPEPLEAVAFAIGASNLVAGENLLAAEVHQYFFYSSDVVFGLKLTEIEGDVPEIVRHPASVVVEEDQPFALSVLASGSLMQYQWQYAPPGGAFGNLPNALDSSHSLPAAEPAHTGSYRVIVANFVGAVTSHVAQVQVVSDRTGPRLVFATASFQSPRWHLAVRFSEDVDFATGRQSANYILRELNSGTNVPVTVLGFPSGPNVRLQTPILDSAGRYLLTVNWVKDRNANVIAPDSQVPVAITADLMLVPMDQPWRWNEENLPLPESWRTNHLAPWLHGEGRAVFYNAFHPPDPCRGSRRTFVSLGPTTHYFTTLFDAPPTAPEAALQLTHLVDDGAVFYLNGEEIARYNLPTGAISHATLVTATIPSATCVTNRLTVTNLLAGRNALAVEVHQDLIDRGAVYDPERDVIFGLELCGELPLSWQLPPAPTPSLRFESLGDRGVLSWTGGGWALEQAETIAGLWHEVQPMTNPATNILPLAGDRFWRLRNKQP